MKVQLVVVRGKPEGKIIPLVGSSFKIGRGETCHLRPNSEQVSREHAEFTISGDSVVVSDLGSRNGTLVNGKALTSEAYRLKDRDLVQVGPLTFAVSISDAPVPAAQAAVAAQSASKPKGSPDDVSGDEIDSWLVGEGTGLSADQPTAVYGGDTITIAAFKDASASPPKPPSAIDDEYERQEEEVGAAEVPTAELETAGDDVIESDDADDAEEEYAGGEVLEELIDESNPFYAAKKAQQQQSKQVGPAKPAFKDTSDAAGDILRRLMERRRASKSS